MPNKALVVGISDYMPPTTRLTAPALEADAWAALLPAFGIPVSEIVVRKNYQATLAAIDAQLKLLFHDARPNERRVFVFAGHGTIVSTGARMGDEALQLYHPAGTKADARAATLTDTKLSEIIDNAGPSPSAKITCVLDCCFSGGFNPPPYGEGVGQADGLPLFSPLLSDEEFDQLLTVHRFGSLWDRKAEAAPIEPLVIAACERGKRATELVVAPGTPPHLTFSGHAIPQLKGNSSLTHEELRAVVNRYMVGQYSVLLGNLPRRLHKFFD